MSAICTMNFHFNNDSMVLSFIVIILLNIVHAKKTDSKTIYFLNDTIAYSMELSELSPKDLGSTIKTKGCKIPVVNPSLNFIRDLYLPSHPLPCHQNRPPILRSNNTHIWILKENLQYYRESPISKVKCCYTVIQWPPIKNVAIYTQRKNVTQYGCIRFTKIVKVYDECVMVTCRNKQQLLHEEFFVFAENKPFTRQRLMPFKLPKHQLNYNIIILGVSSVSRTNFHRTMRRTSNFLRRKEAIELFGFNKVSAFTFQSLLPLLIGMNVTELTKTCWPDPTSTLDSCPFIWERFKDSGYYTALIEDTTEDGIFQTNRFTFTGRPTDYYFQPLIRNNVNTINKNRKICLSNEYMYRVALKYLQNISTALASFKLFALFWESSMSKHVNFPRSMDEHYANFIKNLDKTGYLNETVLILLSDRGIKFGDIKISKKSRLDEKLPVATILVPPSFSYEYSLAYENLKRNSHRLTTMYDMHATLVDLINLNAVSNEEILSRTSDDYKKGKGISLFLPISDRRTCKSAYINKHFCACLK